MKSLRLSRDRRSLMPILALFLMNVPVAEAKLEWPEGTMGNFAMVGLVFTSITVGSGMVGTFVYLFRTLVGIPHESHTETDRRLRESKEWLEYIRWNATQNSTTHPLHEGAAARVLDLEKQLYQEPPPTRALPVRFFKCLIRTAKSCYASATSGGNSTNENNRRDRGKAPERRIPPHPLISIVQRDGFKIGVYHTIYPATAAHRSRKAAAVRRSRKSAHRHRSAKMVRDPGEIGIHYASYKPRGASRKSAYRTKSTTTKDGGKISAYDSKCRSRKPTHRRKAVINSSHHFLRAAKNGFAPPTIITGDDLTIENTHRNKGKAPERRVPAPPQIPTVHRHRHGRRSATTIKDGIMNVTHGSVKSAHWRSRKSAHGHRHRSATHHSSKSAHRPRKSTHRHRSASHHSARRRSRRSTPRHKLAKTFRGHFRTAKNGLISVASGDGSTKSRLDKGKALEPRIPLQSEVPTAHRHRHRSKRATTKDNNKTRTHRHHHICSKARPEHATTQDVSKTRSHRHHHTCSKARSKNATTKDGSKTRTHRHHHICSKASRRSRRSTQRHKLAKIFRGLSRAAKNGLITLASSDGSTKSRLDKGKAPEPRILPQSEIPTAHRHRHRSKLATTKSGSKTRTHRHHQTCSKARSEHATTKYGGVKSRTHPHHLRSLNHTADRPHASWNQHDAVTPPPQANTVATSSKHGDNPVEPAAASSSHHHINLGLSKPLIRFALDPIRPPCSPPHRARKPFRSGAPTSFFDLSRLLSRKSISPSGGSISDFDHLQPTSRKPIPLPGAPGLVHYHFQPEYHTPVPSSATSSMPDLSHATSRRAVPPPGASVSVLDLSQPISRKPVPPAVPPSRTDLFHAISRKPVPPPGASISVGALSDPECRKFVSPSASSSIADLADTESRKPVSPPASSSILNSSDIVCHNPVSPSASYSILNSSGIICRKPVSLSTSSSVADLPDTESRKPVSPPASSSIADLSDTEPRKPVSPSPSSSIPNSSDTICRKPISPSALFGVPDIFRVVSRRGLGWYEKEDEKPYQF